MCEQRRFFSNKCFELRFQWLANWLIEKYLTQRKIYSGQASGIQPNEAIQLWQALKIKEYNSNTFSLSTFAFAFREELLRASVSIKRQQNEDACFQKDS